MLLIAAPWHILATLRNPPYFDFTMRSAPGEYHGFLWFYFINEQLLRFLNMRYPRDYDTVPRLYFWVFHLLWLFPWSVYFPAVVQKLSFKPLDRAGKRACWRCAGPALFWSSSLFPPRRNIIRCPVIRRSRCCWDRPWPRAATGSDTARAFCAGYSSLAAAAVLTLYFLAWNLPTPGDISAALSPHPGAYKLSLGHMEDLTIASFAYLRLPLLVAAVAFLVGAAGTFRATGQRAFLAIALMAILFFQAARIAMAAFDPYLSSRPLAEALLRAPAGKLIVDHHYYTFSSIFFYTNRDALLLNGRFNNLVYGSYAPGAPNVFIDDAQWKTLWLQPDRCYLVITQEAAERLKKLVDPELLTVVAAKRRQAAAHDEPSGGRVA